MMKSSLRKKASVPDSRKQLQPTVIKHFTPNMSKKNNANVIPEVLNDVKQYNEVYKLVDTLLNSANNRNVRRNRCVKKKSATSSTCKSKMVSTPCVAFINQNSNVNGVTKSRTANQTTIISRVDSKRFTSRSACSQRKMPINHNKSRCCGPTLQGNTICAQHQPRKFCSGCRLDAGLNGIKQQDKIRTNLTNIGSNTNLRVSLNSANEQNRSVVPNSQMVQIKHDLSNKYSSNTAPTKNNVSFCQYQQPQKLQRSDNYVDKLKQEISMYNNKSKVAEDARKIINELKSEIMNYRQSVKPIYSSSCTNICRNTENDAFSSVIPHIHKCTLGLLSDLKNKDTAAWKGEKDDTTRNLLGSNKTENSQVQALLEEIEKSKASNSTTPGEDQTQNPPQNDSARTSPSRGENVVTLWQSNKISSNCSSSTHTETSATGQEQNLDNKLEEANSLIEKVKNALNDIGKAVPQTEAADKNNEAVKECHKKFKKVLSEMEKLLQQSVDVQEKPERLVEQKYKIDTKKFTVKCICPPRNLKPGSNAKDVDVDYIIERIPVARLDDATPSTSASDTMQMLQEKLGAISEISTENDEEVSNKPELNETSTMAEKTANAVEKKDSLKIKKEIQCKVAKEEKIRIEKSTSPEKLNILKSTKTPSTRQIASTTSKSKTFTSQTRREEILKSSAHDAIDFKKPLREDNIVFTPKKKCACGETIESPKILENATVARHLQEPEATTSSKVPLAESQSTYLPETTDSDRKVEKPKRLSIQLMPPINIRRGLVMQRALNLSIKPTGSATNTVVTPNTNVGYTEVFVDSKDRMIPECPCAESQTSPQVIQENNYIVNETPTAEVAQAQTAYAHLKSSDIGDLRLDDLLESDSRAGSRRNTKTLLDIDQNKFIILKSFQVMDPATNSVRISTHSFPQHSSAVNEKTSNSSSGKAANTVPTMFQTIVPMKINERSPWDFGFYLSKATQCDETYLNEGQSAASYRYPSMSYASSATDEIPVKDITPTTVTKSPPYTFTEESEEEDFESDECSISNKSSQESSNKGTQRNLEELEQDNEEQNQVTDTEIQVSMSSSESEEAEDEECPPEPLPPWLENDVAKSLASTEATNIEMEEESIAPSSDVVTEVIEGAKSLNIENISDDNLDTEPSKDDVVKAKKEKSGSASSSDSSEFYKAMPRPRSNTIQNFIQGLTGTSEHEFEEVSVPISKSVTKIASQGKIAPPERRKTVTIDEHDSEIEIANTSEEPINSSNRVSESDSDSSVHRLKAKSSSTQQVSEKTKVERLKLLQKYVSKQSDNGDDEDDNSEPKKQTTVMNIAVNLRKNDDNKNFERNHQDTLMLPLYRRVLGRFVECPSNHATNKKPMNISQSDPIPIDESVSEGEISCKHSLSHGEIHLCKFANGIMKEVRQMRKHPEKLIRKEMGDKTLKIARQRTQYNNWVTYYLQKKPRNRNDSSSSKSDSCRN